MVVISEQPWYNLFICDGSGSVRGRFEKRWTSLFPNADKRRKLRSLVFGGARPDFLLWRKKHEKADRNAPGPDSGAESGRLRLQARRNHRPRGNHCTRRNHRTRGDHRSRRHVHHRHRHPGQRGHPGGPRLPSGGHPQPHHEHRCGPGRRRQVHRWLRQ